MVLDSSPSVRTAAEAHAVAIAANLHARATTGVHEGVLEQLAALPRGRLLDAPAGHGALSAAAQALGFGVTACDLDTD